MLAAALRHGHPHARRSALSRQKFGAVRNLPASPATIVASANLADVADREAATLLNKPCGRRLHGFYFAAQRTGKRRELEGSAMSEEGKSWLARFALVGRSH